MPTNKQRLNTNNDDLRTVLSMIQEGVPEQTKTVTPSTSQQTITPDKGKRLSQVTVNAMPSGALSTPTVNASGVVTAGVGTAGYLPTSSTKTLQLSTQAAATITPGTSDKTAVSSGKYTTGAITVKGDSNLVAGNIKKGTSIFGVSGTLEPSATVPGGTLDERYAWSGTIDPTCIVNLNNFYDCFTGTSNSTQGYQSCINLDGNRLLSATINKNSGNWLYSITVKLCSGDITENANCFTTFGDPLTINFPSNVGESSGSSTTSRIEFTKMTSSKVLITISIENSDGYTGYFAVVVNVGESGVTCTSGTMITLPGNIEAQVRVNDNKAFILYALNAVKGSGSSMSTPYTSTLYGAYINISGTTLTVAATTVISSASWEESKYGGTSKPISFQFIYADIVGSKIVVGFSEYHSYSYDNSYTKIVPITANDSSITIGTITTISSGYTSNSIYSHPTNILALDNTRFIYTKQTAISSGVNIMQFIIGTLSGNSFTSGTGVAINEYYMKLLKANNALILVYQTAYAGAVYYSRIDYSGSSITVEKTYSTPMTSTIYGVHDPRNYNFVYMSYDGNRIIIPCSSVVRFLDISLTFEDYYLRPYSNNATAGAILGILTTTATSTSKGKVYLK